jgi:transposase InsO family protein
MPDKTSVEVEQQVLSARGERRRGRDWSTPQWPAPVRTISRILRRHQMPRLRECDPLTGELIRSSKSTAVRYERSQPGELVHMDVKKIGRIPLGGGSRAHGRSLATTVTKKRARVGYDYVHSVVDDRSRFAYSEALADEQGATCAAFFARAFEAFAQTESTTILIKPHCPWQNSKVERFNRTLQTEWVYRQVFTSNDQRTQALAPPLQSPTTLLRTRRPPPNQPTVTNVMAGYT